MARKADLEATYNRHHDLGRQAAAAEASRAHLLAVRLAEQGLSTLADAAAYHRRYFKDGPSPYHPLERVLRLAPPLFLRNSLAAVRSYAGGRTKAEREATPDLADEIAAAENLLAHAVGLWAALRDAPDAWTTPDDPTGRTATLLTAWLDLKMVARVAGRRGAFTLVSDPRRLVRAKCEGCGTAHRGAASAFLDPAACPACGRRCWFVLTPTPP